MHLDQIILTPAEPCHPTCSNADWQQALPSEWQAAAVVPIRFATYREYEMLAARSLGYDAQGNPCYCRQAFVLDTLRSDDDEEFYEVIAYGEEIQAWRLHDTRWLIWRIEYREDGRSKRDCYRFSDCMP
ncbi:MAG: hypothetical protein ACOH2K_01070 [Burkholderiaceae bacterium]